MAALRVLCRAAASVRPVRCIRDNGDTETERQKERERERERERRERETKKKCLRFLSPSLRTAPFAAAAFTSHGPHTHTPYTHTHTIYTHIHTHTASAVCVVGCFSSRPLWPFARSLCTFLARVPSLSLALVYPLSALSQRLFTSLYRRFSPSPHTHTHTNIATLTLLTLCRKLTPASLTVAPAAP